MNTMQLACFAEVASTLSFSRAAANLNVSQPTVSHRLKSLEDELGCELVSRSQRTVALTDKGLQFLGYACDILELSERARIKVTDGEVAGAKRLRVGVSDGIGAQLVSSTFRELYRRDARFDPVFRVGPHSGLVDMLENDSVDAVLESRDPAGAPAGATVFKRLAEVPGMIVCGEGHPLAERAGMVPLGLECCEGVGRAAIVNPHMLAPALVGLQRNLMVRLDPRDVMMCPTIETALSIVAANVAFTLLPDLPALHQSHLRFIPVDGVDSVVFGVRVRRGRRTALLDEFLDVFARELVV